MENLFMAFMIVVSIISLFAVLVVLRDIVKEILASKKEKDNQPTEPIDAKAKDEDEKEAAAAVDAIDEAAATVAVPEEAPAEEIAEETSEDAAANDVEAQPAADEGAITFSLGQQQTLDEKYLALPSEQRGWYDEIIKYASAVEGSKRFKTAQHEEYKVGKNRLVRLLIKRGVIHCELILHNSDFRNYVNENKIAVKQAATTILVESAATVEAVKDSIDIVVASIAEEKEYKKRLAREKRRAARANKAKEAEAEAEEAKN